MFLFRLNDLNLPKISHESRSDYGLRKLAASLGWRILLLSGSFVLTASAQAQQSNGLTFYHLADSAAKDNNGNLFGNIKGGSQTDGKVVAFTSASTTNTCDPSTQLYTVPITGGTVSTLMGPGIKAESQNRAAPPPFSAGNPNLAAQLSSTRPTTLPPAARSVAVSSKFRSLGASARTLLPSAIP